MDSTEDETVFITFDPVISAEPQQLFINLWLDLFLRHGHAAEDYVWNSMGVGQAIVSLAENEASPVKVYFEE